LIFVDWQQVLAPHLLHPQLTIYGPDAKKSNPNSSSMASNPDELKNPSMQQHSPTKVDSNIKQKNIPFILKI
jgi:hypothetical protein